MTSLRRVWTSVVDGPWPLHPLVLAAIFVLTAGLANQIQMAGLLRPTLVVLGIAATALVIAYALIRDLRAAALAATVALLGLFSYQPLRSATEFVERRSNPFVALIVVGLVASLAVAGLGFAAFRLIRRSGVARLHGFANRAAVLLLASVLISGAFGAVSSGSQPAQPTSPLADCADQPADSPPDIYHVLLDGYPGVRVLEDRFGYDNTEFLASLRSRGFSVPEVSHSNYTFTALTFASMFNMRYVDELPAVAPLIGHPASGRTELLEAIGTGTAFAELRDAGYHIVSTPGGWEHVTTRSAADAFLDHGEVTNFERNLLERTWFPELTSWFSADWVIEQQSARINNGLADAAQSAENPSASPQFMFVHLPWPHLPLIYEADGSTRHFGSMRDFSTQTNRFDDAQYGPEYGAQLEYVNRRLLELVDQIEASPRGRDAVILLTSDHGYNHEERVMNPRDRLNNLFAIRAPGRADAFASPPTPVNLYRRLFGAYLGRCGDELTDRYFVSMQQAEQLLMTEVADPDSEQDPTR